MNGVRERDVRGKSEELGGIRGGRKQEQRGEDGRRKLKENERGEGGRGGRQRGEGEGGPRTQLSTL